jgi:hypothetical protein
MKTNYFALFIVSAILLSACSVGVNKDLLSGLKISNSGLSYKDAYLSRAKVKLNNSEFSMGDTVYLYMDGIEGYVEKEGNVFIGASLDVFDAYGKKLMDNPDLFSTYVDGVSKEDASIMSLSLIVGSPLVSGVKYTWKSRVWDKNGKGEINAEVEFTVK